MFAKCSTATDGLPDGSVLAVAELWFTRRDTLNPAGLIQFLIGLAVGVAGVGAMHATDGTGGNALSGGIIAVGVIVGLHGYCTWRFEPVADQGSVEIDKPNDVWMHETACLRRLLLQGTQRIAVFGELRRENLDGDARLFGTRLRQAAIERLVDNPHAATRHLLLQQEPVTKHRTDLHSRLFVVHCQRQGVCRDDCCGAERVISLRLERRFIDTGLTRHTLRRLEVDVGFYAGFWCWLGRFWSRCLSRRRRLFFGHVVIEHGLDELEGLLSKLACLVALLKHSTNLRFAAIVVR